MRPRGCCVITEAGRALDAIIAEKVMGLTEKDWPWDYRTDGMASRSGQMPPPYSTSIAAAWEVVEKFQVAGNKVWVHLSRHAGIHVHIALYLNNNASFAHHDVAAEADTAPLAICLAALKAVGHVD